MSELGQESNVFGGISFENEIQNNEIVENAGTIQKAELPAKELLRPFLRQKIRKTSPAG